MSETSLADDLLILNFKDPLTKANIVVTDIASARYAIKIACDAYFSIEYMKQNMEKMLSRSAQETNAQALAIVVPYLPKKYNTHTGVQEYYTKVPDPLPDTVPQEIADVLASLQEQLKIERERATAELQEEIPTLEYTINRMEATTSAWFKSQIEENAAWLAGKTSAVLSGCTVQLLEDGTTVHYTYVDMEYD